MATQGGCQQAGAVHGGSASDCRHSVSSNGRSASSNELSASSKEHSASSKEYSASSNGLSACSNGSSACSNGRSATGRHYGRRPANTPPAPRFIYPPLGPPAIRRVGSKNLSTLLFIHFLLFNCR